MAIYRQPPDYTLVCLARHFHRTLQSRLLVNSLWLIPSISQQPEQCSTPATQSIFPYGNPTALSSNCVTSFHSVTRSMAAGAISRYWPPASAAKSATAASSASTTSKYFFDIPLKMRNFAIIKFTSDMKKLALLFLILISFVRLSHLIK